MQSFIMNSHEVFIHIHQGCFAGTGAIVRLPQCQWSKPDGYGKISQCITTTKHSKAKTVCMFLGIYCILITEALLQAENPPIDPVQFNKGHSRILNPHLILMFSLSHRYKYFPTEERLIYHKGVLFLHLCGQSATANGIRGINLPCKSAITSD